MQFSKWDRSRLYEHYAVIYTTTKILQIKRMK